MGDALFSAFEKMETTRFVLKVRLLQTLILVQCILGVVHNTVYGSFGVFQLSHDDSVHLCLKNNSPEKSSRTDREIQIVMFTLHAVTGLGIVAWYLCKSIKLLRKNSFELCRTDYARHQTRKRSSLRIRDANGDASSIMARAPWMPSLNRTKSPTIDRRLLIRCCSM